MVELVEVRKHVCPGLSLCTQCWTQFQLGCLGVVGLVGEHNHKRTITNPMSRSQQVVPVETLADKWTLPPGWQRLLAPSDFISGQDLHSRLQVLLSVYLSDARIIL